MKFQPAHTCPHEDRYAHRGTPITTAASMLPSHYSKHSNTRWSTSLPPRRQPLATRGAIYRAGPRPPLLSLPPPTAIRGHAGVAWPVTAAAGPSPSRGAGDLLSRRRLMDWWCTGGKELRAPGGECDGNDSAGAFSPRLRSTCGGGPDRGPRPRAGRSGGRLQAGMVGLTAPA